MARETTDRAGAGTRLPASDDDRTFDEAVSAQDVSAFEQGHPSEVGPGEAAPPPAPAPEPEVRHIPISELLNERDKRRKLEAELERYEAAEKQRQAQQQQPDYLTQPQEFTDQRIHQALAPVLQPIYQHLQATNRQLAVAIHGAEAVDAAEKAFNEEWQAGRMDRAIHFHIQSQPNPFVAAVKYMKDRQIMSEVGDDPAAYRKRIMDEALNDPEFLGRAVEAARLQATGRPVTAAPRTQAVRQAQPPPRPNGGLPPSLNRQGPPGGDQPTVQDLSDLDLYDEMINPAKRGE